MTTSMDTDINPRSTLFSEPSMSQNEAEEKENKLRTREKEREELDELNKKLADYFASITSKEAANKQMIEMIEIMRKTLSSTMELQTTILSLEKKLEMKNERIISLQTKVEDMQKESRTIEMLRTEHGELESALTKQIKAQNECDTLTEEKKYVENTSSTAIWKLEEVYKAEYKLQLENLRTDQKEAYDEQLKKLEAENLNMRASREEVFRKEKADLERKIAKLEDERADERAGDLSTQISTYRNLLDENIEISEAMEATDSELNNINQQKKVDVRDTSNMGQTTSTSDDKDVTSQSSEVTDSKAKTKEYSEFTESKVVTKQSEVTISEVEARQSYGFTESKVEISQSPETVSNSSMISATKSSDKEGDNEAWETENGQDKITDENGEEEDNFDVD